MYCQALPRPDRRPFTELPVSCHVVLNKSWCHEMKIISALVSSPVHFRESSVGWDHLAWFVKYIYIDDDTISRIMIMETDAHIVSFDDKIYVFRCMSEGLFVCRSVGHLFNLASNWAQIYSPLSCRIYLSFASLLCLTITKCRFLDYQIVSTINTNWQNIKAFFKNTNKIWERWTRTLRTMPRKQFMWRPHGASRVRWWWWSQMLIREGVRKKRVLFRIFLNCGWVGVKSP